MLLGSAAMCLGSAVGAPAFAADDGTAAATAAEDAAIPALEAIVVTAQKRDQSVLLVPVSLDVFTGKKLEEEQVFGVEELTQNVAGVNIAEFADGQYRLVYRGVGATGTSDNQNFSTSLDGVIVPYNRAFRLLDLDRVEVLKGPQGTLYGRNTNAGVINVISKDGSKDSDAEVAVYGGSGETFGARAAFGGPVGDGDVFYRVAGRFEQSQGFIENTVLGIDDSHATDDYTVRGTVGVDFADGWRATARMTYDKYDNNADNLTSVATPYDSTAPDLGKSSGELIFPSLTVEGALGDVSFTSISAYASVDRDVNLSAVISPVLIGQEDHFDSLSQEFRLDDVTMVFGAPTSWVAGLYLLNERNKFASTNVYTPFNLTLVDQVQHKTTKTASVFGEAEIEFLPSWIFTGGLRVAYEDQKTDYRTVANGPFVTAKDSFTSVQPKAVLAWQPEDNFQAYLSATRGFRAGSVFISNPVDPRYDQEDVWQYEAGLKGNFLDGTVSLSAAGFYIDWTDMQVQRSVITSTAPFTISTIVDNASSARSYGMEFEGSWRPTDTLDLFSSFAWTDAKYEVFETTDNTGAAIAYSGNRIEFVPETETTIGATFRVTPDLEVSASATHIGEMAFDSANTAFQDSYTMVDASIAYDFDRYRISVTGRNLTDEAYFTRGLVTAQGVFGYPGDPRTIMAELSARF